MKKHNRLLCKILSAALALSVVGGVSAAGPVIGMTGANLTASAWSLPVVTVGNYQYELYNDTKTAVMVGYTGSKDLSSSNLTLPSVVYSKDVDKKEAVGEGIYSYKITGLKADIFKGCTIKLLTLPQNLEYISNGFAGANIGGFYINPNNQHLKTDIRIHALYSKDGAKLYAYPSNQQLYNTAYKDSLVINNDIQYIGAGAFANCQLSSVTLPESITKMGGNVFSGSKITSVTFEGSSPEFQWSGTITKGTFEGASKLSYINIKGKEGKYATDSYGVIYNTDKTILYYCPEGKTAAFTLPETCSAIRSCAFYNSKCNGPVIYDQKINIMNDAFKNVSDSFTIYGLKDSSVYNYAKENKYNFKEIFSYNKNDDGSTVTVTGYNGPYRSFTIPAKLNGMTVTAIGEAAFRSRTDITSINLPSMLTTIEKNAFMNCTNLSAVTIPGTVSKIGEYAFYKTAITKLSIPAGMTAVNDYAFYGCDKLSSLTIHSKATGIGNYSFAHCTALRSVSIPDSVTEIKTGAFYNCTSLTNLSLGNGMRVINSYSFENAGLTSQFIPQTVTFIGTKAFGYTYANKEHNRNTSFTKITGYPGSTAEKYAKESGITFSSLLEYKTEGDGVVITKYNGSDTTIEIPGYISGKPVKAIGQSAFSGNKTLKKITIAAPVKEIRSQAFYGMTALESVTLPGSLDDIGAYAFAYCGKLNNVYLHGAPEKISDFAFLDCASLTNFNFKDGVKVISAGVFANTGITNVSLPITVSSIGNSAFGYKYSSSSNTYSPMSSFTLTGYAYTAAESYAGSNSFITFIPKYENISNMSEIVSDTVNCGQDIIIKAAASGGKTPFTYKVSYAPKGTTDKTTVSDFSSQTEYRFCINEPGAYEVYVQARDARGMSSTKLFYVTVKEYSKLVNRSSISKKEIISGDKVTINCAAEGGTTPYQYAVLYKRSSVSNYSALQGYSSNTSVVFKPQTAENYNVLVKVKDANGRISKRAFTVKVYNKLSNTSSLSANTVKKGQKVTVNCSAAGGKPSYLYYVGYKKITSAAYSTAQYYTSSAIVDITPVAAVNYSILVKVKDKMGNIKEKSFVINVTK